MTIVEEGGSASRPSVRSGLGFAAGSFAFSVLAGLGSSVLTSRLYGVNVIGEYALVSLPYIIASQMSQVNEGVAFTREAATMSARSPRVSGLFRAIFTFSTALTVTVAAVVLGISTLLLRGPVHQPGLVGPAIVILAGYVLIDNVNWNIDSLLSAFRAGDVLFWARTAQVLTFLVVGVGMAAFTTSVWGLVVATIASFAVPLVIRVASLHRFITIRVPRDDMRQAWRDLPGLIRFGIVLTPTFFLSILTGQAGTWLVGSTGSLATTGAYGRAQGLSSKFLDAGYRVVEILMPSMVERHRSGDVEGTAQLLRRALTLTAVPLLAIGAAAGGAGEGVLRVFGPGFARAHLVLAFLDLYYVLNVLSSVQSQGFIAIARLRLIALQSLGVAACTLATMWPLERAYGATGVALAYALWRVVFFVRWDRKLGLELTGRTWLLGVPRMLGLAATTATGFVVAWSFMRISTGIVCTSAALATSTAAAIGIALVLGVIPADDRRAIVETVGNRMRRR